MNCRQIEQLIPLFAGGDLDPKHAAAIALHLETCDGCRRLAGEFSETHDWLAGSTPPRLDQSFLDQLRSQVLREIDAGRRKSSWFDPFALPINWRLPIAVSTALVLVILIAGIVAYRQTARTEPGPVELTLGTAIIKEANPPSTGNSKDSRRASAGQAKHDRKRSNQLAPRTGDNSYDDQLGLAAPASDANQAGRETIAQEVTRIEFQTADPNIRIIWFASNHDAPQSSKTPSSAK